VDYSHVTPDELRTPSIPAAKNGLDPAAVDRLLSRAASTIDDLSRQVGDLHQTIAVLRSESATIDLPTAAETPAEEVLVAWLASLDPLELERHVEAAIAESMVESTIAARRIRQEAIARTQAFADSIATEAVRLNELISGARGSVAAMNRLSSDLAAWQLAFQSTLARGLEQLQMPWSTQIYQVAQLLAKMNGGRVPDIHAGGGGWKPVSNGGGVTGGMPGGGGGSLADTGLWGS
jgi:hypothetical protein